MLVDHAVHVQVVMAPAAGLRAEPCRAGGIAQQAADRGRQGVGITGGNQDPAVLEQFGQAADSVATMGRPAAIASITALLIPS